ncbi:kinase-like protein [Terfezia boudieri ATCC MYA-4762]|uniref:Kinase-like protein n=1 Tax=Terfezia boudieri ATCC MYA-4762 TaxID=1051890 RepID=A0A3N4LZ47_9PEZI|nr:kinase-like protein [Terfezia boudieri ATCC MYA-4762]
MFSNALKSFTSNINSNYILSPQPISTSGPWRIHDAKKKSTGQAVSVFVFDRKSLEPPSGASSGLSLRSSSSSSGLKVIQDEVVERLKREASSLARLRHPAILELVEPVEETRSGGLQFVTEQVTGSLGHALKDKDEAERNTGRGSRYVVDDGQGGLRRREVEIDELDIQKGLLQIAKGLEFLHESAGLTHCNLTPEAVYINAKSDWKLSALAFATAHGSTDGRSTTSVHGLIAQDPRLPLSVQLSYDYTSPDLLLDSTLSPSTDLFSLGLLIVALYNSPHESPLQTHNSASTYKRLLSSPSTTPNAGNGFLSTRPLPKLMPDLLSRLLTRRPANRLTAREFQQNSYFDNILVSTLRFLESLPAKTASEKSSFMRGLLRVLPQFPKSVLEKKVLPILVEELKDKELLPSLLPNIFSIIDNTPGGSRLFSERVLKRLKSIYLPNGPSEQPPRSPTPTPTQATLKKASSGIGSSLESGLVVILDHLSTIIAKTTATEFKEDILPIIYLALESPTHSLQDRALQSLETILPASDFPTVKNELFPVVANVFAKTSSLGIKIRGLQAFKVLCGGTGGDSGDGLDGGTEKARGKGAGVALDKYTVQEKMVPLLKGIKTKEPGVMMAALDVFNEVGRLCDREVLATEIIPVLWSMSLGPLLNLEQFQAFMSAIKAQSHKIEQEQTQKLKELSTSSGAINANGTDFLSFGGLPGARANSPNGELEFEKLVLGKELETGKGGEGFGDWGWSGQTFSTVPTKSLVQTQTKKTEAPRFEWSTPSPTIGSNGHGFGSIDAIGGQGMGMSMSAMEPKTNTNGSTNLLSFSTLQPTPAPNTIGIGMGTMQPLQPSKPVSSTSSFGSAGFGSMIALRPQNSTTATYIVPQAQSSSGIDWSSEAKKMSFLPNTTASNSSTGGPVTAQQRPSSTGTQSNVFSSFNPSPSSQNLNNSHPTILFGQTRMQAPPNTASGLSAFKLAPPPSALSNTTGMSGGFGQQQQPKKTGLDAWESLL